MRITPHYRTLAVLLLLGSQGFAQEPPNAAQAGSSEASAKQWAFSLTADGYIVPHRSFYVNPNFTADRGWLHLEARYNYEDQETGSLWVGYNFSYGKKLELQVTPMIGGVIGRTAGVAPGCEASLSYKKIELTTQGEYVFDVKNSAGDFFYSWSELTYSPRDWITAGLVAQKTKAYQTPLDVQRGVLVSFSHKNVHFTTYVFDLGWTDPTVVLELGYKF